jgi:hypothetical protein
MQAGGELAAQEIVNKALPRNTAYAFEAGGDDV